METSPAPVRSAEQSRRLSSVPRSLAEPVSLFVAAGLLVGAIVSQFVIGPTASPGFTYLAVLLTLGAIGALLAAGLKA